MAERPATPDPDDKDWTWVLERPCPECGFDASTTLVSDLPVLIEASVAQLWAALERPDTAQRPSPEVWSVLEYACHVRDVCRIFGVRLSLMRGTENPLFPNWDQDATAIADEYWAQDPEVVREELREEGQRIADDFATVTDAEWIRPGRRSNGSVFTVESIGRYFVHDLRHHVYDIG